MEMYLSISLDILKRHFNILTELLNMHYETKKDHTELEEQLLLTLLLVLQGAQAGSPPEKEVVPVEAVRNCLIGLRLTTPYEQHFFQCNTCSLAVCEVCAPFLHKHHDLSYTGKEGSCVHDASQKKIVPAPAQNSERNIFAAQPPRRREDDLFALNFDLGGD